MMGFVLLCFEADIAHIFLENKTWLCLNCPPIRYVSA